MNFKNNKNKPELKQHSKRHLKENAKFKKKIRIKKIVLKFNKEQIRC